MLERAKGTRDLNQEDALAKEKIVNAIKECFKLYGFYPIETSSLERYETLTAKYAGGQEIVKEIFRLTDQGNRELALRYDLTVPLARYIAGNPNVKMPFKRYQIGNVYRDGPIKASRYREFTQADADIVGSKSMLADAECINLAFDVFKKLGIKAVVKVNNRKLMDAILNYLNIKNKEDAIIAIDKLEKIGSHEVKKELKMKGLDDEQVKSLMKMIGISGNNNSRIKTIRKAIGDNEGIREIEELTRYVKSNNLIVDFSLARGLAYYTGNVFEAFSPGMNASIAAGGRYDNMIAGFIENNQQYPSVGIAFGVDVLLDIMKKDGKKTDCMVYIIPIGTEKKSYDIVKMLRNAGVNSEMDVIGRGISKNLDYANLLGIPYVLFVGKQELAKKKVKLRDMKTGKERMMTVKQVIDAV